MIFLSIFTNMKASKPESMRSIRSNKSIRAIKSMKNVITGDIEKQPPAFEECLPLACQKYACPFSVTVKKDYQLDDFYKQLKSPEEPVKYKRITVSTPHVPVPVSQVDVKKHDDKTTVTTPSELSIDEDTINVTVLYDNVHNLTEIHLSRVRCVPRSLVQIIGYLAPLYEYLTKITMRACNINSYTIYELSKILDVSSITDICLDGSPVTGGNYFILLDARIKYLSLCRCKINDDECIQIATRLHHLCLAEKTLLLLNLSSNRITDEGAKCLGQALRTNRRLRYLNLADNHIGDEGAGFILDSLIEFQLTYDETMNKRKRRLEYLKAKRMCFLQFLSEYQSKSSDEYSQYSRKSVAKKTKTLTNLNKRQFKKDNIKKDASVDDFTAKAELFANELLGPFVDPFSPLNTLQIDGSSYCIGNMSLCYLNLSYNRLSFFCIQKLLAVLQYQKVVKRINQTGLIKVVIEGNNIPIGCVEYLKINELTRLAKSTHNLSGRMSNAGLRQKGRQTRISVVPQLSSIGRN